MGARVIVVGAGPVGLTIALSLVRAGIQVTVLEAGEGPSQVSRASTFHPPTLELLEEIDLAEHLLRMGLRAPTFQYRDRTDGIVAEFDLGMLAGETRYPFRVQCEQNKLCAAAMPMLAGADVRFGHAVERVGVRDDGVVVHTSAGVLDGDWVIGADGAHSAVRESLGIGFEGLTYPERFLVVSTTFELRRVIENLCLVNYIADPAEWFVLLRTPDHWRILFPVEGDEPVTDADVVERLKSISPELAAHPVATTSTYRIHQRVAAAFRQGRALLAGDAAHINNPLGGMGMNAGLHDAFSLAQRLAAVIQGRAPDGALDEYATLRRTVALQIVDAHTRQNYERIRAADPAVRMAHLDQMRESAADPERAKAYMRHATLFASAREML